MRFAFVWLVVMIAASVAASDTTDSTRKALATKEIATSVVAKPSAHQRRRLGWSSHVSEWASKMGEKPFIQKSKALYRKFRPAKLKKTTTQRPDVPLYAQSGTIPIPKKSSVSEPGMFTATKLDDPPVLPLASIPVVEPIKPPVSMSASVPDVKPIEPPRSKHKVRFDLSDKNPEENAVRTPMKRPVSALTPEKEKIPLTFSTLDLKMDPLWSR
ncbi:hypothetical protein CCR75_002290 [Bremia lactucae]|uniref:Uncharacterized protein n=1 Tax=Bremia lactucae TaxID=4779 RepID=A0A976IEG6_BRELC|nr:hypothetical protein CCR75_002290 [Bremia lactucae]